MLRYKNIDYNETHPPKGGGQPNYEFKSLDCTDL